jgi:type IV secretion system protein VirB9
MDIPVVRLPPPPPLPAVETTVDEYPSPDRLGTLRRFPYSEYATYRIATAPGRPTLIQLAPGEGLQQAILGDTTRWTYVEQLVGQGMHRRVVMVLQPHKSGLRTDLVVLSTWHVYQLELLANQRTYFPQVAWQHPLKAERSLVTAPRLPRAQAYQLRIQTNPWPAWTPVRVWDDGERTYVECPPGIDATGIPLFYAREGGEIQRVNHHREGTVFVLHRVSVLWQMQDAPEERENLVWIEQVSEPVR